MKEDHDASLFCLHGKAEAHPPLGADAQRPAGERRGAFPAGGHDRPRTGGDRPGPLPQARGTGACAVAVASILNGYTEREVEIRLLGGNLQIEWNEEDNHVYMTGPATVVFDGEIEL